MGSSADDMTDGEETDRENLFGINVETKKKESSESEEIEDGIKAFRQRLKAKQSAALKKAQAAQLNIDNLSSSDSSEDGDKEQTFDIDEEENKLNDWIDAQQRLKQSMNANENENQMDDDESDDDEPLVVDNDMDLEEMNDPFFKSVHDESYMKKSEPFKKRMNEDKNEGMSEEQRIKERAMLEMMMASDGNNGFDPENTEVDNEQLSKNLNKRLKRNWRLRWLIKKAVKRKLAE